MVCTRRRSTALELAGGEQPRRQLVARDAHRGGELQLGEDRSAHLLRDAARGREVGRQLLRLMRG